MKTITGHVLAEALSLEKILGLLSWFFTKNIKNIQFVKELATWRS